MRCLGLLLCLSLAIAGDAVDALLRQARDEPAATVRLLGELSRRIASGTDAPPDLAERLDPLCRRLFLEGWRVPGRDEAGILVQTIAAGDSLGRIARARRINVALLLRLNPGIDPRRLAVGGRVVVLDAAEVPLRIVVDRAARQLTLWRGSMLAMACRVGVGAPQSPTPAGRTTLALRVQDPEWRDPTTGRVHPPHSPGNLLGGWWLGFAAGDDGRFRSIGCHGWTAEDPAEWVGREASHGCVRMRQEDIADLAALVVPGVAVEVR